MTKTTTTTISGMKVTFTNNNGSLEVKYPTGHVVGLGEDAYGEMACRIRHARVICVVCHAVSDENKRKIAAAIDRVMAY